LSRAHHSAYDEAATARCERVLITLLGDLGPWRERVYLAGGLAPRYLIGALPEGARAHVGTTDVDLVIGLALGDETPETYRTLQNNLEKARFEQREPSFRWARDVEGATIFVEFLCETDEVEPGRIFRPKGESTGSKLGAFNVRGAHLVRQDFVEREIEGERLDGGGQSRVAVRVANVLPYTVLKITAFQDRHENKDAYDLVLTLLNHEGGPRSAGRAAAASPAAQHPQVRDALGLLEDRFAAAQRDGPNASASFLAAPDDAEGKARLRQESLAPVRAFLNGFRSTRRTTETLRERTEPSWPEQPAFGEREAGRSYVDRPSAYVVLVDDDGRVAVVSTPQGVHLPGGGQHAGESPERAVLREVMEECASPAGVTGTLGRASEFCYAEEEDTYFAKRSTFFTGRVLGVQGVPEPDHELLWLAPDAAEARLRLGSHAWAVARARAVVRDAAQR